MHKLLSNRYGRPTPWIMKPSDGFFSSGIFLLSSTNIPMLKMRQFQKQNKSSQIQTTTSSKKSQHVVTTLKTATPTQKTFPKNATASQIESNSESQKSASLLRSNRLQHRSLQQYRANVTSTSSHASSTMITDSHKQKLVAQEYVHNPLIWRGRKFDFRFNVVVTSISPTLRIHMLRYGFIKTGVAPFEDDLILKQEALKSSKSFELCKHITTATEACMNWAMNSPKMIYKGSKYGKNFTQFTKGVPLYSDEKSFLKDIEWLQEKMDSVIINNKKDVISLDKSRHLWSTAWDSCKQAAFDTVKLAVMKMEATKLDAKEEDLRERLSVLRQFGVLGFDGIVDEKGRCFVEEINLNGAIIEYQRIPRILDLVKDEIRLSGKYNEKKNDSFNRIQPYKFMDTVLQFCQDRLRNNEGLSLKYDFLFVSLNIELHKSINISNALFFNSTDTTFFFRHLFVHGYCLTDIFILYINHFYFIRSAIKGKFSLYSTCLTKQPHHLSLSSTTLSSLLHNNKFWSPSSMLMSGFPFTIRSKTKRLTMLASCVELQNCI